MLPFNDILNPPTADEVFNTWIAGLISLGLRADLWRKGGVSRSILRVLAMAYSGMASLLNDAVRSAFLDYSSGAWLTLLAWFVFRVQRLTATFATGELTLTNSGGGIFEYLSDEAIFKNSVTGKTYTNVSAFVLNPADVLTIAIRAREIGTASNASPGDITEFETTMEAVTATNAAAVIGTNAQEDEPLRQLCRAKVGWISPMGPRDAYEFAVLNAKRPSGQPVNINRHRPYLDELHGILTIYCAAPSGAPDPDDLTYVKSAVEAVRPDLAKVRVVAATVVTDTRSLVVYARRRDGLEAEALKVAAQKEIDSGMSTYPIGGLSEPEDPDHTFLYGTFISGSAKQADPSIFNVTGASEDFPMNPGEVVVLDYTITVRFSGVS
jgi:phage-related baseplate assembly protein